MTLLLLALMATLAEAGDTVRIQNLGAPLLRQGLCYSAGSNRFYVIGLAPTADTYVDDYNVFQLNPSGDVVSLPAGRDYHSANRWADPDNGNLLRWLNGSFYLARAWYDWAAEPNSRSSLSVSITTERWSSVGGWWQRIYGLASGASIYCAVGLVSYENKPFLLRSFNGRTWSEDSSIQGNPTGFYLKAVAYGAYGGGIFAAVGTKGTVLISDDAASWVPRSLSSAYTDSLNGVCYGNGCFVAVGDYGQTVTGAGNPVWNVASTVATLNKLNAVCYGDGRFVAVGDSGTWLSSTNGQDWTRLSLQTDTGPFLESVTDVAYGNGSFVAISPAGYLLVHTTNEVPVTISIQPQSQAVLPGSSVEMSVVVNGSGPLAWQWLRNGTVLTEGGSFEGVNHAVLRIASVQPTNAGNYQVVVSNSFGAVTSDVAVLRVARRFVMRGPVCSCPAIGADGTLYVGTTDYMVNALDGANGAKRWVFATGGYVVSSPAIGADGTVYIGSNDQKLYALNGATGAKRWEFATGRSVEDSPAIGADGTVYLGAGNKKLCALSATSGATRWEFATDGYARTSPAIGIDGTVYLADSSNKVYAVDGATGAKKWEFYTGSPICRTLAIGADGSVYVGSASNAWASGRLLALDGTTGAKRWEFVSGWSVTSPAALGDDGTVYVGASDDKVYALDGTTGVKRWEFYVGYAMGGLDTSPAIGADGTVYIGLRSGVFFALNGRTGAKKWKLASYGSEFYSPTIGADGTVFIANSYGSELLALDGGIPPANSAWPMFGGNAQHTWRVRPLPPGPVNVSLVSGQMVLRWSGDFTLQSASNVTGPWGDLAGATNGYQVTPTSPRQFFRLRSK
ncbi:MAG TPA: PQQ-binding-like beta-propeller repeat protein [Verrucomicrobiae bacterium]